jgi:3-oxoacyl-[acyl-carrier-protein] synthase III
MGALHLALNPELSNDEDLNIAEELQGKKVLVGGIEALSRLTSHAKDKNALQLFGNGAGVIGIVPGETMKFLTGKSHENYDEDGLLQLRMFYPHSKERIPGKSMLETQVDSVKNIRIAGLMHEPPDGAPILMAGLMGMVKLFVRTGVDVVTDVFHEYHSLMDHIGRTGQSFEVAIVHHANYKINLLKAKQLMKNGVNLKMPWLLSDFGNVSAASCMIAFLRQLQSLKPGDHVLFDGFGAGTYYDVMAVSMG